MQELNSEKLTNQQLPAAYSEFSITLINTTLAALKSRN